MPGESGRLDDWPGKARVPPSATDWDDEAPRRRTVFSSKLSDLDREVPSAAETALQRRSSRWRLACGDLLW